MNGAQGIVMPPRVAPLQVIVIPIPAANLTDAQRAELSSTTADLVAQLKKAGVRVQCDDRDNYRPGWKYNHWEVKVRPKSSYQSPLEMPAGTRLAAHHRSWGSMCDEHFLPCAARPDSVLRDWNTKACTVQLDFRCNGVVLSTRTFVTVQGVPIRLELGSKDMEKKSAMVARRDTGAKEAIMLTDVAARVPALLEEIQVRPAVHFLEVMKRSYSTFFGHCWGAAAA
jgi:prolyl-tRNA synthetase